MQTTRYVALLRGVNVGGKMLKMATLKEMLESMGYTSVKTLLNSGNALFEATERSVPQITKAIEQQIEETFGFHVDTIVHPVSYIQKMIESQPFKDSILTPDTRFYVTFLSEKPQHKIAIPYESPGKYMRILKVTDEAVILVITVSAKIGTTDAMKILEKEFGKKITTRNWNTVQKIVGIR